MRYRPRVLLLLFFLSIVTYLDRVAISVAGPAMQDDLGISIEHWGWVIAAFTVSYAMFEIPTGAMGDRIGPRRILTRVVVWWSAFTTLTGLVSNFFMLLIVRFLFGAGEAGAYPNASATISRWFPLAERARAQSVVWMASRLGGLITPFLVFPLQAAYGWRAAFIIFGGVGLVWAAIWYWWFRDTPVEKGASQQEIAEIGPAPSGAHIGLPWGVALRSWNLWKIMIMYHTYCWGGFFYLGWLGTYLQRGRGLTPAEMATFAGVPFAFGALGNLFGGWLGDKLVKSRGLKFSRRVMGTSGLGVSAVLMLGAAMTSDKWMAVAFLSLGYGAMDCMLPSAWAVSLDVGRRYSGTVAGTMNMAGQVGSFLSSVSFGYLVTYFGTYNAPLYPMVVMLLIAAGFFAIIDPTEPLIPEPAVGVPDAVPAHA